MSVEKLSLVLNHSTATGTDKLVLIGIANHDGDGGAWPAIATLARYANVDRRTVQRSIRNLEELGELAIHVQQGGTMDTPDFRRPNRYEITVRGVTPTSPEPSYRTVLEERERARDSETTQETTSPPKSKQQAETSQPASPPPNGDEQPDPFCDRHPDGTDYPCGACGTARKASERWEADQADQQARQTVDSHQFREWAKTQPECPHGIPGGNIERPAINTPGCPACRRSRTPALTTRPPDRTLPACPHGMAGGDWLTTTTGEVRCPACRTEGNRRAYAPLPDQTDRRPSPEGHRAAIAALEVAREKREAVHAEQAAQRAAHAAHMDAIRQQVENGDRPQPDESHLAQ